MSDWRCRYCNTQLTEIEYKARCPACGGAQSDGAQPAAGFQMPAPVFGLYKGLVYWWSDDKDSRMLVFYWYAGAQLIGVVPISRDSFIRLFPADEILVDIRPLAYKLLLIAAGDQEPLIREISERNGPFQERVRFTITRQVLPYQAMEMGMSFEELQRLAQEAEG